MSVNDRAIRDWPETHLPGRFLAVFSGKKGNIVFNIVKMHIYNSSWYIIATSEIIWLIVGQVEKTAKGNVAHFLQTDTSWKMMMVGISYQTLHEMRFLSSDSNMQCLVLINACLPKVRDHNFQRYIRIQNFFGWVQNFRNFDNFFSVETFKFLRHQSKNSCTYLFGLYIGTSCIWWYGGFFSLRVVLVKFLNSKASCKYMYILLFCGWCWKRKLTHSNPLGEKSVKMCLKLVSFLSKPQITSQLNLYRPENNSVLFQSTAYFLLL